MRHYPRRAIASVAAILVVLGASVSAKAAIPSDTTNGIYHGVYSDTGYSPDNNHGWAEHSHGPYKYASVYKNAGGTVTQECYEVQGEGVAHADCDAAFNVDLLYLTLVAESRTRTRMTGYCSSSYTHVASSDYSDGHGVCYHINQDNSLN